MAAGASLGALVTMAVTVATLVVMAERGEKLVVGVVVVVVGAWAETD